MIPFISFFAPMALAYGTMPNVPGAWNPNITQENIHQTICVGGYSTSVRPDPKITGPIKKRLMKEQGITGTMRAWELDHRDPISLGGDPNSLLNMWLETRQAPWGAATKDQLELRLHSLVCHDKVTLADAHAAFDGDWTVAYKQYVSPIPRLAKHRHRKKSWLRRYF